MLELGFWAEERGRGGGKDGGRSRFLKRKPKRGTQEGRE